MQKDVWIDDRYESYQSFFDHAWSRKFLDRAKGTIAEEVSFDLATMWRGAANTFMQPWLMLQSFKSFTEGALNYKPTLTKKVIDALVGQLVRNMKGDLSQNQQEALQKCVQSISERVEKGLEEDKFEFPIHSAWSDLLRLSEFQLGLWGSQYICYTAVYYSYEDFLVRCVGIALKNPKYRIPKKKQFSQDIERLFDRSTCVTCWDCSEVDIARVARHAIVHNGGRLTDELKSKPHKFRIENNVIQVYASDTHDLFDALKEKAYILAEELITRFSGP